MSDYDFRSAKTSVLIAIHQNLHSMRELVWLEPKDVRALFGPIAYPYLIKVLNSLLSEKLVEFAEGSYGISEDGILLVEQQLLESSSSLTVSVPASDRVVGLDHNTSEASAIDAAFSDLEEVLRTSNDAFLEDDSAREIAVAETSALRRLWIASAIRIDVFRLRAQQSLSWISDKAATTVIAEACKHLIKLIFGWS